MKKKESILNKPKEIQVNTGYIRGADTSIFQMEICLSAIFLFLIHTVFGLHHPQGEFADKTTYIAVFFLVLLFCLAPKRVVELYQAKIGPHPRAHLVLMLGVVISLGTKTVLPGWPENSLWWGYGWKVAICGVLAATISYFYENQVKRLISNILVYKVALNVCFFIMVGCYLLSLFTPPLSLLNANSAYVVNEILGPVQNKYPGVNFIAQYTQNLGYVFKLLGFSNEVQAIYFLEVMKFFVLALLVYIFRLLDKKAWRLVLILFLGISFGTKPYAFNVDSGSIAYLHSALPVRIVSPIVCFFVLYHFLMQRRPYWLGSVLGICLALGLLINIEIGISTIIATLAVLSLRRPTWKVCVWIGIFFGATVLLQLMLMADMSHQYVHLSNFFSFIGGFSSGFGAKPMPRLGLWIAIFSVIIAIVACGYRGVRHSDTQSIAYCYFGVLTLMALPYYINRSVNSGQLQLIIIYISIPLSLYLTRYISNWFTGMVNVSIESGIALILFWFCFFSNINIPNPGIELVRLSDGFQRIDSNPQTQSDSLLLASEKPIKTGVIVSFSNILASRFPGYLSLARLSNEEDAMITGQDFYKCDGTPSEVDKVIVSLTIDGVRQQVSSELLKCGFTKVSSGSGGDKYAQSWYRTPKAVTGLSNNGYKFATLK